jgi:hypothetical protein
MPDFFRLISEYFWLVALGFAAFNYWKADRDTSKTLSPGKVSEAKIYLRNFALASALPWVIMGAGQVTGVAPTVWHYFRPQDGNVFVLGWLASVFALSCLFAWWVFLAGGARKTVEFNLVAVLGQHGTKPPSEKMIKFFAALGVFMFPIWVYMTVSMNAPLPG